MNSIISAIGVIGILLLSGCSVKEAYIAKGLGTKENIRGLSVTPTSTFASSRSINTTNTRYLQIAAEETLRSGYRYFELSIPKVVKDMSITTPEQYLEKCTQNNAAGNVLLQAAAGRLFSNDACGMFVTDKGSSGAIRMYKEKPADTVAVLDASEVIEYLKSKQLMIEAKEAPSYSEFK
ncbi:MAG: hypothetical protein JU82_00375 [Sulfuricurvum sp. MLSB]|uniref:hypothetical protein n=1 Tax=unclassified Sulfuricurvum TaxID=2632390 RepID=UPI000504C8B0|nr:MULTISPECIES: hypothetical protein [unclassified Sulfuricurvum]KFN40870.1 MAG: hypothetical protein JU82_00375 [Sulfuricurvum sp. MLSB]